MFFLRLSKKKLELKYDLQYKDREHFVFYRNISSGAISFLLAFHMVNRKNVLTDL